jgi:hypothetical protein
MNLKDKLMIEEKIKTRVTKAFKDGKLLSEEDRTQEITEKCVTFEDNVAVAKISISREFPIMVYGFGGNAKASVHISVPCVLEESEVSDALKYATSFCDSVISEQSHSYKEWLDSQGIDWKKIEKVLKNG